MKQLFIVFSFFFIALNAKTQSAISIFLTPELVNSFGFRGAIVSDENGESQFHQLYENANIEKPISVLLKKESSEILYLTLIKEFQTVGINSNKPYYKILTIRDLYDGMLIDDFEEPIFLSTAEAEKMKEEQSRKKLPKFNILGIENFDRVIVDHPGIDRTLSTKKRKGNLIVEYKLNKDTDAYFLIQSKDEAPIKYAYFPYQENQEYLDVNFADLPTDLKVHTIKLPSSERWYGRISAKNEDTGNRCYFYYPQIATLGFQEEINLYLPESQFFYDFEVTLFSAKKEYVETSRDFSRRNYRETNTSVKSYLHFGQELPESIELADFVYDKLESDNNSAQFEIDDRADFVNIEIHFHNEELVKNLFPGASSIQIVPSTWKIISPSSQNLAVKLPEFPNSFLQTFPDISEDMQLHWKKVELFQLKNKEDKAVFRKSPNLIHDGFKGWQKSGWGMTY